MWNNPGAILPHPSLCSKSKIFVQEENKLSDAFKELLKVQESTIKDQESTRKFKATLYFSKSWE